jgi:hypothetical protein
MNRLPPCRCVTGLICMGACVLSLGCGRANSGRVPIFGRVAAPGNEPFAGTISFIPMAGETAPAAVGSIVDGKYRFDTTDGPGMGKYRVLIRGHVEVDKTHLSQTTKRKPVAPKKKLERNEWTQSAEITAGASREIDFALN